MTREDVEALLEPLIGSTVTAVRLRAGSYLMIDLMAPEAVAFLWICAAAWRLDASGAPAAASEDDHERILAAVEAWVGHVVAGIQIDVPALDLAVSCADMKLNVFPIHSAADPDNWDVVAWAAWLPAGDVLVAGPGVTWSVQAAAGSRLNARRAFAENIPARTLR